MLIIVLHFIFFMVLLRMILFLKESLLCWCKMRECITRWFWQWRKHKRGSIAVEGLWKSFHEKRGREWSSRIQHWIKNRVKICTLFRLNKRFSLWEIIEIIFCSGAIIVLCRIALFIPILAEWKLTMGQEYTLFAVLVFLEVITVGVIAFIPVMLILYIILGHSLKKIFRNWKKQSGTRQSGQSTRQVV